ncbi:gtpase-activating protein [Anaeramoeba flamelloides]|uniref:Gtpase-activating protein n=1 Tax=Anaeramoeba flamelloides TaxID=1746091 RepID=A0AAV7ZT55_9EUKA|nr:gtpase-activating protein [Anaeramoeba flamelloides]
MSQDKESSSDSDDEIEFKAPTTIGEHKKISKVVSMKKPLNKSNSKEKLKKKKKLKQFGKDYKEDEEYLKKLKNKISSQSKRNFELEKNIKTFDQKIALLIKNRISLDEVQQFEQAATNTQIRVVSIKDERVRDKYSKLLYLIYHEPKYISLCTPFLTPLECEKLLQIVMFTIYGNHYDQREEKLLFSLFKSALHIEFKNCTHVNTLLRANTTITKLLFTYTRRGPGQLYLKNVLSEPLTKLANDEKISLEINPVRIYEHMINLQESESGETSGQKRRVTEEEANQDEKVQEILKPRIENLKKIFDDLLNLIIEKIEQVPYGIRLICKQIKDLTFEFFPNATLYDYAALIGGFFILRFLNPAVVVPTAYHIVEGKLSPNSRRNLTLIAKVLQVLSNMVDSFGKKEAYMGVLSDFMKIKKTQIAKFLDKLCDVPPLEIDEELERYLALAKEDVTIQITLNEIYFLHGLMKKYIDKVAPEEDDLLRTLLKKMGDPPKELPRKDDVTVLLTLTKMGNTGPKNQITKTYLETKTLLFQFWPQLTKGISEEDLPKTSLIQLIQKMRLKAKKNKEKEVDKKLKKILYNMKKLVQGKMLTSKDNFLKLREDIAYEIKQKAKDHQRMLRELELLNSVRESVRQHSKYLHSQLEVYQTYLDNVRQQAYEKNKSMKGSLRRKRKRLKFSYSELEKIGVLVNSEVPEKRRNGVFFKINNSETPGLFTFGLYFRNRPTPLYETIINMETLLEAQHMNENNLELEHLSLNVNLLIHLLKSKLM